MYVYAHWILFFYLSNDFIDLNLYVNLKIKIAEAF